MYLSEHQSGPTWRATLGSGSPVSPPLQPLLRIITRRLGLSSKNNYTANHNPSSNLGYGYHSTSNRKARGYTQRTGTNIRGHQEIIEDDASGKTIVGYEEREVGLELGSVGTVGIGRNFLGQKREELLWRGEVEIRTAWSYPCRFDEIHDHCLIMAVCCTKISYKQQNQRRSALRGGFYFGGTGRACLGSLWAETGLLASTWWYSIRVKGTEYFIRGDATHTYNLAAINSFRGSSLWPSVTCKMGSNTGLIGW